MQKVNDTPVYFMVQSSSGKTHAINPKTQRTYCGCMVVEGSSMYNWRPLDVAPSDQHQPTCKICLRHYDDPLKEQMREIVRELKTIINDFFCTTIILKDVDRLGRFVTVVKNFSDEELKRAEKKVEV